MRHATDHDLDRLESLLAKIRSVVGLVEKKRGIFYWKSKAFLHFHEHEGCFYADVRLGDGDFDRIPIAGAAQERILLAAIEKRVANIALKPSVRRKTSRTKPRTSRPNR
jgi:hypothetical protein